MSSFFPGAITSWNNVIKHFHNTPPFNILKGHILSLIHPSPKSIFGVHDPLGLRYLFQLRVNLIPLRIHKSPHNFLVTHSDICHCNQGIEDVSIGNLRDVLAEYAGFMLQTLVLFNLFNLC